MVQMVVIVVLFFGIGLKYYEVGYLFLVGEISLLWFSSWFDLVMQVGLLLIWIVVVLIVIIGWDYFDKVWFFLRDFDVC